MMMSEFIERTGFEPTGAEYEQIEAEYMGTEIDKDQFCKEWKKNGGIQRLMRLRARRIEELEAEVRQRSKEYDELDAARCKQISREQEARKAKEKELEQTIQTLRWNWEETDRQLADANKRAAEAEQQLATIREAFKILGIAR